LQHLGYNIREKESFSEWVIDRCARSEGDRGIGWLSWNQLRKILEITKAQFRTQAERKFVEDLIVHLDYKIREGERFRTERKQLSFW
jgi:hypothetical protein